MLLVFDPFYRYASSTFYTAVSHNVIKHRSFENIAAIRMMPYDDDSYVIFTLEKYDKMIKAVYFFDDSIIFQHVLGIPMANTCAN